MKGWLVFVALVSLATGSVGCGFDGAETRGLPCDSNLQCGPDLGCERGFCGGPPTQVWGPCLAEGCFEGEQCVAVGAEHLTCAPPCSVQADCFGYFADGDPVPLVCAEGFCLRTCDSMSGCMDGTDCVNIDAPPASVCGWYQP